MRIKSKKKKLFKIHLSDLFYKIYFYVSLILILALGILFFNTGYWSKYKDQFLNRLYTSSVNNYIFLPEILIKKIKAKSIDIPDLNLNISFKNQINLENQRNKALEKFGMFNDSTVFKEVNAAISFNNDLIKTNIRLKGDRKSHWFEKDRTSYKLDLKGDKKLLGMEKFSLQKPRVRNYIHEWLFYELLGKIDLIKLNYKFVNLSINGASSQLYALEESFDKILVERNKKRNGPIFSLHEEFSTEVKKAKFEVYNKKSWLSGKNLEFTQTSRKKLEIFFKNENSSLNIFDTEKWASFFAITDLNYYPHARAAKSVKFFYNPVSAKFEPIGYDAHRSVPNYNKNIKSWYNLPIQNSFQDALNCKKNLKNCIENGGRSNGNYLVYRFFFDHFGNLNKEFFQKYKTAVLKVSSIEFLDSFFSEREKQIEKINSLIYDDYFFVDHNYFYGPGLYYFSKEDIYIRAKNLQVFFENNIQKIFVEQENDKIIITNTNHNNLGLKIIELTCQNKTTSQNQIFKINKSINSNNQILMLSEISNTLKIKCTYIKFSKAENIFFEKIIHQNIDSSSFEKTKIDEKLFLNYFTVDKNQIFPKSKNTIIDKNIIIPKNYSVQISPGDQILFKDNSFIFSYSPWHVNGKEKKVIISGLKNDFGGGILILDTNKPSIFENVEISYLSGLNNKLKNYINPFAERKNENEESTFQNSFSNSNQILYGAINFYNAEALLKDINFKNICSEDVVNIISSNFLIKNSSFEDNCSDAIDIDFGKGKLINLEFKNIGNDAIDFSGSNVELKNINLENISDKLISAGENSNIKIDNLVGKNANIGIASKDGSLSTLQNITIDNVKIGLASYIKKNEYGPGKIVAENTKINDAWKNGLTDDNSKIILNNNLLNAKSKNLVRFIYGENN